MQLAIDPQTGQLRQLLDRTGNRLTFTPDGIQHSAGRHVRFTRDYADRITEIVLPDETPADADDNPRIRYQYDGRGDLVAVTDRSDATTRFTYLVDPAHYLDSIIDPLGRPVAKTEYDAEGRVVALVDAAGNRIETRYDVDGRTQSMTDPLGFTTTQTLDARGNVIREIDPTGVTVKRTFDAQDRLLSETLVVGLDDATSGETDDLTTRYVYNDAGDLLETIDPRGNSTRQSYNQYGQPLTVTDSLGNTTRNNFDQRGLLRSITDPLGNAVRLDYDTRGNVTGVRDASEVMMVTQAYNRYGEVTSATPVAGRTMHFDYTTDGDPAASWYFDSSGGSTVQVLNRTQYDDNGRAIGSQRFELPEGQFVTQDVAGAVIADQYRQSATSTVLNAAGQTVSQTDQNGLVTQHRYDLRGQLIETRQQRIDAQGQTVWMVSRTVYDAAGRAIAYTDSHVEGSTQPIDGGRTFYDGAGRVVERQRVRGIVIDIGSSSPLPPGAGRDEDWLTAVLSSPGELVSRSCSQYDTAGRASGSVDHYNFLSRTVYNRHGETVESRRQSLDQHGQKVWLVNRTVYDALGRGVLQTDSYLEGYSDPIFGTQTIYDSLGRAAETVRRSGIQVALDGNETRVADWGRELYRSQTFYDAEGRVVRTVAPDGQTNRHEYDSLGRQIATVGHPLPVEEVGIGGYPAGTLASLRTETVYDSAGQVHQQRTNLRQLTLPDGSTAIDDSEVQTTTYQYDAHGNLIKTVFSDGTFLTAQYDALGRKVSETNQLNQTRSFEYDEAGRLSAVQLPGVVDPATGQLQSPRYEYGYDAQGNQTLIRDPLGRETWYTFDAQNRQLSRTLPLGFGTDGMRGTGDDPVGWTSTSVPPADLPFTERVTYDRQGRQHLHVSFEGVVTEHVYSEADGRLVAKRFFDNLQQYDGGAGTPGEVWTYTHDAFGRVIHVAAYLRDDHVAAYLRDAENPGEPTRFESTTYDAQGRVASVTTPEGTVRYTYDVFDRLTSTIVGTRDDPQRITRYAYDALGRLKTVSEDLLPADPSSPTLDTRYGYTLLGSLRRTDLPNGMIEHYVYDPLNRLDLLTHYGPDDTPEDLSDNPLLARFDYEVQADGRRTSLFEEFHTAGGAAPFLTNQTQWQYDALGRLVVEDFDSSDDSLDYTESFVLDLAGNRLQKTRDLGRDGTLDETTDYAYDANDRLWSEAVDRLHGDAARTEYDWRFTQQIGKTVYQGAAAAEAARVSTTDFRYDLQGRLEAATVTQYHDGQPTRIETTAYDYNSRGIRIAARTETDTDADGMVDRRTHVEFLNDANNHTGYSQVLRESHYETVDQGSRLVRTVDYTFGHDELLQRTVETNDQGQVTKDETLIFGHDGHSSVRMLTDLAAAAVQFYAYDAYGQMLAIWNDAAQMLSGGHGQYADASVALTNLLYAGEQFDSRIQQQYLRARYYDPTTGRFNRLDPFFGNLQDPQSFHKYLYAHADPINGYDPTGAYPIAVTIGIFAISTGIISGLAFSATGGAFWDGFVFGAGASLAFMLAVIAAPAGGAFLAGFSSFLLAQGLLYLAQVSNQKPVPISQAKLAKDMDYALLAKATYRDENPAAVGNWQRVRVFPHLQQSGYRATLYENVITQELVLAFAGTDDPILQLLWGPDWRANYWQGALGGGKQYRYALQDARWVLSTYPGRNVHFTGHSLGGGLASTAALRYGIRATTFNAAGLHAWTIDRTRANELIDAYRVQGEILSTLQDSGLLGWLMPDGVGKTYYLPGTGPGGITRHSMNDVIAGMVRMGAPAP